MSAVPKSDPAAASCLKSRRVRCAKGPAGAACRRRRLQGGRGEGSAPSLRRGRSSGVSGAGDTTRAASSGGGVQHLVSGCTPAPDRSQGCKSRRPDDHNDVRKASNAPLVLFSETRRKQPSKTEKMSIVIPCSVPLRIPQVVIVCPKKEETALSLFLRSKRVTDGRKCPKNGTQKPDHLIRTGSYVPVGGIDTS